MSKVCIVFDRLRAEEKMLQKEALELGHDVLMLDAKITQINTDSKKEDYDLGDIVLERCVSYFRGLHFTASLEFMDIPVLNKFEVANICGNKMFMTLLLKKNNIPTPAAPAFLFMYSISFNASSFFPSTATGTPFSNLISK